MKDVYLNQANAITDHLNDLCISETFLVGSTEANLYCRKSTELSQAVKFQLFNLFETNMKKIYNQTWGWNEEDKKREIFAPDAYFLAVFEKDETLVGFSMFKLCWDDDDEPEFPVLYVHELHVSESYQRLSVGSRLMQILLEIAGKRKMFKTMLTCFKINEKAMSFYKKIGFKIDCNSPSRHDFDADYEILSDKPNFRG